MMHTFCSNLSWNCLDVLIRQFTDRIAYGVRAELLELAQISGVSASLARVLFNLGLKTQVELAQKTWKELLELVQNYTTTSNSNNQSSVRELIGLLTTDPESCVQGIVRDVKQTLNKKATQLRRLADECDQQIDDNYDDHSDVEEGTIIFDDSFDEGMTREGDLLPDF
ncbi:ski2-like helicase [compost metagenome]